VTGTAESDLAGVPCWGSCELLLGESDTVSPVAFFTGDCVCVSRSIDAYKFCLAPVPACLLRDSRDCYKGTCHLFRAILRALSNDAIPNHLPPTSLTLVSATIIICRQTLQAWKRW
jgi:hypothetical protein